MPGIIGVDKAKLSNVARHLLLNVMGHFHHPQTLSGEISLNICKKKQYCVSPLAITWGSSSFVRTCHFSGLRYGVLSLRQCLHHNYFLSTKHNQIIRLYVPYFLE